MHKQFPNPVDRLHVLLLYGLDRNEMHRWSEGSFHDGFSVVAIVLVRLDEGGDVLGADQAHLDAHGLELTRPVVR